MLNMIIPMSIVAGADIQGLWDDMVKRHDNKLAKLFPLFLAVVALGVCFYQSLQLNFFHHDNEYYVYPYVQPQLSGPNCND